jgi:hypothetical protein
MLGGMFIRTGSVIAASGVRVVSGLVQRLGLLSFISDNAGCLGGRPFPRNGRIMSFSSHEVCCSVDDQPVGNPKRKV